MCNIARLFFISVILLLVLQVQALCVEVCGEVCEISKDAITATFPVRVKPRSMMVIMVGEGRSVAGVAISEKCTGKGPYNVRGKMYFVTDVSELAVGKKVYIDNSNTIGVPVSMNLTQQPASMAAPTPASCGSSSMDNDLKLYYFAAGQNVGYGALGLGYERTIRLTRGLGLQLDGGVTGFGSESVDDPDGVDTEQVIKSLNGRLKMDFNQSIGVYSAYRWNEGRGEEDKWDEVIDNLEGKPFTAASDGDYGEVLLQGFEYGLTLRPMGKFSMSLGYIPKFRADYGSYGVRDEPGYAAELRFGTKYGAIRLRGISSDNYWLADLGITIR